MRRMHRAVSGLGFALWLVAGAILLGTTAPVTAQEATPAPIEVGSESTIAPAELAEAATEGVGGGSAPSTMPSAGVGSGLTGGGTGSLSLGALVGAGVAAIFALRERFKSR